MCIRFVVRDRLTAGRSAVFAGALFCALSVFAALPSPAAAELCPPADPDTCLTECYRHKRECWQTCTERKRQCIAEARLEANACRLECRAAVDGEDIGVCKRRCVASGLRQAVTQCKLGRPVCLKECNPHTCPRRCDAAVSDVAETCEPPADLECFGVCAREWRVCLERVRHDGRACAAQCSDLRGDQRRMCLRECAEAARAGAQTCTHNFRTCAAPCWDARTDVKPGVAPPTD